MLHRAPAYRTRGPRHGRPRRHDLRTRDEARPQRELPLSCRRRPRREGARLHGTRRAAKTSRPVGCSRRRTLSGPRPPALPHRVPRAADRQGTRGVYYLDQPRTVSEIADRSDNYRNTVNRVLKRFRDRGPVGTTDGHYEFNADFDRLHEFARELAHHLHRQRLEAVAPKGTILWEDYDEFLAQAETEIDAEAFHETGLARFAAFDL